MPDLCFVLELLLLHALLVLVLRPLKLRGHLRKLQLALTNERLLVLKHLLHDESHAWIASGIAVLLTICC